MARLNLDFQPLELERKKKKPQLELKESEDNAKSSDEGFKPFPVELLDDPKPKAKQASKQPAILQEAFGKQGGAIEKKSQAVVKEVAKAEGLGLDKGTLQSAAIGLVPILLGGLLGGTDGALAGVAAGAKGIETLEQGKLDAAKLKKEQEQKDREISVKEEEVEVNKLNQKGKGALINAQTKLAEGKLDALKLPKPAKALTEGQSKARIFGMRTRQAEQVFSELEKAGVDFSDILSTTSLPNIAQSTEAQQFNQAKLNFLNAALRKESGAVISDEELDKGDLQYFPQKGDSPEVLEQKRANRTLVTGELLNEGQVNINELQSAEDRADLDRLRKKFKR